VRAFSAGKAIFLGGMSPPDPATMTVQDLSPDRALTNQRLAGKLPVELFTDCAVEFLQSRETRAQPFLAYVAFNLPHDPRIAPREYHERANAQKPPLPPNFLPHHPFNNGDMSGRDEQLAPWPRTPEIIRQHLADYYASIEFLDAQIGRILEALRRSKQSENTIIVFASDHGLAIGSHGLMGKQNLYEHSMRAPLIFVGPGIPRDARRDAMCYLLDIFPTLGALAAVPPLEGSEGESLVPHFAGSTKPKGRPAIFTAYGKVQRAIRDERWKLIIYPQLNHTQLFDLRDDPAERSDLAAQSEHRSQVERLTALLRAAQRKLGDKLPLTTATPLPFEFDFSTVKPTAGK
jgi:arylsulfatase A-like enzyme